MLAEELLHGQPLVPPGAIDIEPDRGAAEPPIQVLEGLQKAGSVPLGHPEHAAAPHERRHPAAEIEPIMVLTGRGDAEALAALAPAPPEAGMEGEACLIREGDGGVGAEGPEFFLAGVGTPAPRSPGP